MDANGFNSYYGPFVGTGTTDLHDDLDRTGTGHEPYFDQQPWHHIGVGTLYQDGTPTVAMQSHGSTRPPFSHYPEEESQGRTLHGHVAGFDSTGAGNAQRRPTANPPLYSTQVPSTTVPIAPRPQQNSEPPPMQLHPSTVAPQQAYSSGQYGSYTTPHQNASSAKQKPSKKGQPRERCQCACGCAKAYYPLKTMTVTRCSKCRGTKDGSCRERASLMNNATTAVQFTGGQSSQAQPAGAIVQHQPQPVTLSAPFNGYSARFTAPALLPQAAGGQHALSKTGPVYSFGQERSIAQTATHTGGPTDALRQILSRSSAVDPRYQDIVPAVTQLAASTPPTTTQPPAIAPPIIDQEAAQTLPPVMATSGSTCQVLSAAHTLAAPPAPDDPEKQQGGAGEVTGESAQNTPSTRFMCDHTAEETQTEDTLLQSDSSQRAGLSEQRGEQSAESDDYEQQARHRSVTEALDDQFFAHIARMIADFKETEEEAYQRLHPFNGVYTELFREISTIVEPKDVAKWNEFVENNISDQSMKINPDTGTSGAMQDASEENTDESPHTVLGKRERSSDSEGCSEHARKHQRASGSTDIFDQGGTISGDRPTGQDTGTQTRK
ncbi:hypothetical protein LTR85_009763 [Meristemomyces frigidus]|nr:hypothetical protein LTR85_009763 [Meristemomyces frigidus]